MTEKQAIKGLKENMCSLCAYGSQNMDSCDIRECDNRDYIKALEQPTMDKAMIHVLVKETDDLKTEIGRLREELTDKSYELWKESYEEEHLRNIRLEEKIKALEQQPSDCVSRKAILERIEQIVNDWNNDASHSFSDMCKINGILKG